MASTSFSADIKVKQKPTLPSFVKELIDQEVNDREAVVFSVEVENSDKVDWYLDDVEISDDEDFIFESVGKKHSFQIKAVNPEDSGKYECRVGNSQGIVSSSCILTVFGN